MKYGFVLFCLTFFAQYALGQAPACCIQNTDGPASGMLAVASTDAFARAHESPEPFQYEKKRGSDITFQTLDGKPGRAYYLPAPEASTSTLIIFHEWWGLNDYIRREADRLQDSLGPVDIYAIDLYDGQVATTQEEATKLSAALNIRRTDVLIKGMLAKAGRDNQIATLGWCLGGSYAFRAAVLAEKQAAGCVMYYGFPEKDAKNITPLQTDILYIRATKDQFINPVAVNTFAEAVRTSGHIITVESYEAAHAFANPSNPQFDAVAAAAAEAKAIPFIRKYLVH